MWLVHFKMFVNNILCSEDDIVNLRCFFIAETSCLCLDWSLCNDCAYIAAGFADGMSYNVNVFVCFSQM